MLNSKLDYFNNIDIPRLETTLGKCLIQPHSSANSSSRKLMLAPQLDQRFGIYDSEVPIVSTGYENKFADHNSSFIKVEEQFEVIAKIPKFLDQPNHNYIMVFKHAKSNNYIIHERKHCNHNSETYGFLFNNEFIDALKIGDVIQPGAVIQKSRGYDDNNNRQDGRNALTVYLSLGLDMEDGIIISESFAKTLDAPLIKEVSFMVNKNNIPLNLYGDDKVYKSYPYINEHVINGNLYTSRLEKKEESLFSQSVDRLKKPFISDDKYTVIGKVVDINIYCNEPEYLHENYYNEQLLHDYNNSIRYSRDIVNTLGPIIQNPNTHVSYEMESLFLHHDRILKDCKWIKDKQFNFCMLEFLIEERNSIKVGDKIADRYGGKGVVAAILPDHMMPRLENGEIIDIIIDSNSAISRLNPGQFFEVSTNMCSSRLLDYMNTGVYAPYEEQQMYLDFLKIVVPNHHTFMKNIFENATDRDIGMFLNTVYELGNIYVCGEPIEEAMSLQRLEMLYQEFPFIKPYKLLIPQEGSNGHIRFIPARRTVVAGKKYYYRLKQYAKEKSSATSLSSTNLRGLNTKSRANKDYKSPYSSTPTTFGNMEHANMAHIDQEILIVNFMLHSASPHGRKLIGKLYDEANPFEVDIKLDNEAKNRNVEILNAYLKGKGLTLEFYKMNRKLEDAFSFHAFKFKEPRKQLENAFRFTLPYGQLETAFIWNTNEDGLEHLGTFDPFIFKD